MLFVATDSIWEAAGEIGRGAVGVVAGSGTGATETEAEAEASKEMETVGVGSSLGFRVSAKPSPSLLLATIVPRAGGHWGNTCTGKVE